MCDIRVKRDGVALREPGCGGSNECQTTSTGINDFVLKQGGLQKSMLVTNVWRSKLASNY